MKDQTASLGHQGGSKDHGYDGHDDTHGGKLRGQSAKDQQVLAAVFPCRLSVKVAGNTGGKAEEKAEQKQDNAPRSNDSQKHIARSQQEGSDNAQHNGYGKNPPPFSAGLNHNTFVLPVKIDEVVYFHLPDALTVSAEGMQVDQGEIERRQRRGGKGET